MGEVAWEYLSDLEKAQLLWMRPDLKPPEEKDSEDDNDEQE